jgi:hypothetical protein
MLGIMAGYEKIADLMTKHVETSTFQRFGFLNTLNILYLQAELVHLEQDLRASMKEDLESGSGQHDSTSTTLQNSTSSESSKSGGEIAIAGSSDFAEGPREGVSGSDASPVAVSTNSAQMNQDRCNSTRDWWYLSNGIHGQTWEIMLKAREKLAEYSRAHRYERASPYPNTMIDEAVLKQTKLRRCDSPNPYDLQFLQRWFKDKAMGDYPLVGLDSKVWESSSEELLAVKARKGADPLAAMFLGRAMIWWHRCAGQRVKKPLDEEAQYFEYKDKNMLHAANVIGSIISSLLLVGSMVALYFVNDMLVRLGIVAIFTQLFSLTLICVTSARKIEIFAATAG